MATICHDTKNQLTTNAAKGKNNQTKGFIKMAKIEGAVIIDQERCKGCDLCVAACPTNVLELKNKEVNDRGYHFAYAVRPADCIGCSSCAIVCPDGCIEVYRITSK